VNFRTLREVEKSSWFPLELFFQFLRVIKKDALALPQGLSQDQAQSERRTGSLHVSGCCKLRSLCLAEQDPFVEVVKVPKFDMPFYESKLSKIDVKALAKKYDIPLDLHPCAPSEGLGIAPTVNLFRVFYKISKQGHWFSFEKRRVIPDTMAWRYHDSDVNDVLPDRDYNVSDARTLVENIIDLHPMPPGLLFVAGLATTWDFPGFQPIFKDTRGNGILSSKVVPCQILSRGFSTTLLVCLWVRRRGKSRRLWLPPKKKENTKRVNNGEGGSKPKPKKRKTLAAKKPRFTGFDLVFVPISLRAITPTKPDALIHSGSNNCDDGTRSISDYDHYSIHPSPHESADEYVHNYDDTDGGKGKESPLGLNPLSTKWKTLLMSPMNKYFILDLAPMICPRGLNVEEEMMVHVAPPAAQEESNALPNHISLERAWFNLARGLAQTDMLKRFKNLQDDYTKLVETHKGCSDTVRKLVFARQDLEHNSRLYTDMSNRYKTLKEEHLSCEPKVETVSAKGVKERERLIAQLSQAKVEKFNCIHKLLPTVVKRLLQIHEYKQSLFEPFNMAIQARKLYPMYDKLFEKEYPFVMKIANGYHHIVADLLKIHPDPAPSESLAVPTISSALAVVSSNKEKT
ncbi:hypothetical protein Tco_1303898, partial [Tanacetum coccineum]